MPHAPRKTKYNPRQALLWAKEDLRPIRECLDTLEKLYKGDPYEERVAHEVRTARAIANEVEHFANGSNKDAKQLWANFEIMVATVTDFLQRIGDEMKADASAQSSNVIGSVIKRICPTAGRVLGTGLLLAGASLVLPDKDLTEASSGTISHATESVLSVVSTATAIAAGGVMLYDRLTTKSEN
jgi:hypothetical protein